MIISLKSNIANLFLMLFFAVIFSLLLTSFNYSGSSTDSTLYNKFVEQLAAKPLKEILIPEWKDLSPYFSKDEPTPYVRDHYPGQFMLPVIATKLGFPSSHVLYVFNIFYKLIYLWLFYLILKNFLSPDNSAFVLYAGFFSVLSFNYLLRADHEQPLLIFALLSILAGLRLESNKWWFWGLFCASGGGFFVKGLASFYIPLFGLFSFIYVSGLQIKKIGLILLSYSSIPLFMGIYELYFHKVTGLPFFSGYWTVQMAQRTLNQDFNLFSKISNLFYYLSRAFLYSLPWSFFAAYFFIKGKKINNQVFKFLFILAMIPILGFSCFNRIASRYVFVSNFLFSVLCIMYVFLNSPWLKNLHQKLLKNVERVTILIWGMLIVLDLCLKEFVSKVL